MMTIGKALFLSSLICNGSALMQHYISFVKTGRCQTPLTMMEVNELEASTGTAALLLTTTLASAQVAFASDVDVGAYIFSSNCAACHSGGNNVIIPDKSLRKEALISYLSGGYKESSIVTQVSYYALNRRRRLAKHWKMM